MTVYEVVSKMVRGTQITIVETRATKIEDIFRGEIRELPSTWNNRIVGWMRVGVEELFLYLE